MFEDPKKMQKASEGGENRKDLYDVTRLVIGALFKSHETGRERIDVLRQEIIKNSKNLENSEKILAQLEECVGIKSKSEFIDKIFLIMKPLIDFKMRKSEAFDLDTDESNPLVRINDVLSYEKINDSLSIHTLPERIVDNAFQEFKEGLIELAKIVNLDISIKNIKAQSWIVSRHSKIVEQFGFVINNKKLGEASMTREEFLKRYLKLA